MAFTAQEATKLRRIITLAEKLLYKNGAQRNERIKTSNGKRIRRNGKELARFRRMLKAERNKGVSVATLARKHGISSAYIYSLP